VSIAASSGSRSACSVHGRVVDSAVKAITAQQQSQRGRFAAHLR
jgi:hypothetical protein